MRTSNISNNMTSINKMLTGEENRNRELHGHHHRSTPTSLHTPRPSMPRIHIGKKSIFIML
jgi:hypothetical protein